MLVVVFIHPSFKTIKFPLFLINASFKLILHIENHK